MEKTGFETKLLGNIVSDDFRTAEVFMQAGIDFCCGGKKTLRQACEEKGLDVSALVGKLEVLADVPASPGMNFNEWSLAFLADYIVNSHHIYIVKALPDLLFYTRKIANVHGDRHRELLQVAEIMVHMEKELLPHLKQEEEVLFPAIKEVLKSGSAEARTTIASEIARMDGEHTFVGGAMDTINRITHEYAVPEDGCDTYRVTFKLLKQFEDDLHVHVHLENNILYPKALLLL